MYAEPEVAVQNYIDALLSDPPSDILSSTEAHAGPGVHKISADAAEAFNKDDIELDRMEASEAERALEPASDLLDRQQAFVQHLALAQQKGGSGSALHSPYPEWADDEFRCLLVNVANLKLAIPSCFIDSTIACVPGNASGEPESILVACDAALGRQVMTADTAKIVMPERYESSMRSAYRHKVMLKDCDVALAVDNVAGEAVYQPRDVRWRGAYTRRFWLAGTVIKDMCALLDVAAIHREVLASQVLDSEDS